MRASRQRPGEVGVCAPSAPTRVGREPGEAPLDDPPALVPLGPLRSGGRPQGLHRPTRRMAAILGDAAPPEAFRLRCLSATTPSAASCAPGDPGALTRIVPSVGSASALSRPIRARKEADGSPRRPSPASSPSCVQRRQLPFSRGQSSRRERPASSFPGERSEQRSPHPAPTRPPPQARRRSQAVVGAPQAVLPLPRAQDEEDRRQRAAVVRANRRWGAGRRGAH